ncbi:MAG: hypothetical protein R3308_04080, partial [Thiohalobacterales bacterium]|nr:hypothetical protein [Thiohalobacterales bacterium]
DVPGLIEGAAGGAGLGVQFLKHLSRTRLLLHLVDMGPGSDPLQDVQTIIGELQAFDPALAARERWLVLNKMDLVPADERPGRREAISEALGWDGPVFEISALTSEGVGELVQAAMAYIEQVREDDASVTDAS